MLTLDQCLKNLSVGVLSNISWGNDGNGSIRVDKVPTVVGHINEALLRLYTKFIINISIHTFVIIHISSSYLIISNIQIIKRNLKKNYQIVDFFE